MAIFSSFSMLLISFFNYMIHLDLMCTLNEEQLVMYKELELFSVKPNKKIKELFFIFKKTNCLTSHFVRNAF